MKKAATRFPGTFQDRVEKNGVVLQIQSREGNSAFLEGMVLREEKST